MYFSRSTNIGLFIFVFCLFANVSLAQVNQSLYFLDFEFNARDVISDADLDSDDLSIVVFPNPTTDMVNVKLNIAIEEEVKIYLYNDCMEYLNTYSIDLKESSNENVNIDFSAYPIGKYYIILVLDSNVMVRDLIKI